MGRVHGVTPTTYDMIVIGAGSGNSVLTPDFDDWNVAIVERGPFGGTCLNRGCIPSKMFVYASDMAEHARNSGHLGVDAEVTNIRWPEIRDRVFGRIDPIAAGGEDYRKTLDNVTVYNGDGRFVGHKQVQVGDDVITAETIVLAAGARPFVPDMPGLADAPFHTSASIMRLDAVPEHLIILGGGFIACEMAHIFGGLGSEVTIVNRSASLLKAEDREISEAFTEIYSERFNTILNAGIAGVAHDDNSISITCTGGEKVTGDVLLVATGRIPNGAELGVDVTGVELDDRGYVVNDEHMRTNVEGIWALGDICTPYQLKHVANAETKVVAHNIADTANNAGADLVTVDYSGVPSAVFAHPQIASLGATEQELEAAGTTYIKAIKKFGDTAYGWAMEDTTSFCKLLADPETRLLLGAHIMGPQAATLIQQLIQGMQFGQTVDEMARGQMYIHPALTEVVENALLEL